MMNLIAGMMPALAESAGTTRPDSRRSFLLAGGALALGLLGRPLHHAPLLGAESSGADNSHQAQVEAAKAMPLSKMNDESQRKVLSVLERPSIYRKLPTRSIDCDPELFVFLARNPEVVVNIWELMKISQMTAERTGAYTWKGNDGQGTESNVELVYGTDELHLYYGEGFYEGPLLKRKVAGRAVVLLRSNYGLAANARAQVNNRVDVFIAIDNVGAELLAKTLQPMVGSTADVNFTEAAKFLGKLSQTAEANPDGMPGLAQKLNRCDEQVKRHFTTVSMSVGHRVAERTANHLNR
jgi:hypothetical protein